ncbi:MAG: hypothetical protein Kow0092_29720 [Deferrisomatales bacterium]
MRDPNRTRRLLVPLLVLAAAAAIAAARPARALTGAEELAIGLAVELIAGLTAAAAQSGATQVRCKAQVTGPDGDDKKANLEFDTEQILETDLDCDTGTVMATNGSGLAHWAWAKLHYKDTAPAGSERWGPNLTDYKDKNGIGGYTWTFAWAHPDDDPEPGNQGSENCKGPNATCAAGVAVFALEGEVTEKLRKADAAKVESASGGGSGQSAGARAAAADTGLGAIAVSAFGAFYAAPGMFDFLVDGDTVTVVPRFGSPVDLVHSTGELDVSPTAPDAPPALLPPRFLGLSELGDEVSGSTWAEAAAAVPGLAPADATPAELTVAGAALAFAPLTLARLDGGGAERGELDLLAEYFASPTAVRVVAPALAQPGYVPRVTHREVVVGDRPISAAGIAPELRGAVLPAVFGGTNRTGARVAPDLELVGLLIGVEGSLLEALDLSAATPGSELRTRLDGLAVGDEFDASVSVSSGGGMLQTMHQTVGLLFDDFTVGDSFLFLDTPGTALALENDPSILTGQREIALHLLSSASENAVFLSTQGGVFSQDQADEAFGVGRLTWDGPDARPGAPGEGDGRFDLGAGGANAFAVRIDALEPFGGQPLDVGLGVEVVLVDGTAAAAAVPLTREIAAPEMVLLPYHLLGLPPSTGPLPARSVSLVVDGSRTADYRIAVDSVGTTRVDTWPPYVDTFAGEPLALQRVLPGPAFASAAAPLAPGGQREATVEILATEGVSSLDLIVGEGGLVYFQGPGVLGRAALAWDGPDGGPAIDPNPLPGFDPAAVGADAFALTVESLSFGGAITGGIELQLLLYPSGGGPPLAHPPAILAEPLAGPVALEFPLDGFAPVEAPASAAVGEAGPAAVVLEIRATTQDNVQLVLGPLQVVAPVCGDGEVEGGETCDDGNLVPADGCSVRCRTESLLRFRGPAAGGSVELVVEGVPVTAETVPGMSAPDVAVLCAAAIHGEPALAALGITAAADGDTLATDGRIDDVFLRDAGLLPATDRFARDFGRTDCCAAGCPADLDGDCDVDGSDLARYGEGLGGAEGAP